MSPQMSTAKSSIAWERTPNSLINRVPSGDLWEQLALGVGYQMNWLKKIHSSEPKVKALKFNFRAFAFRAFALCRVSRIVRRTHPRSALVKGRTFNSGYSALDFQWRRPKIREISWKHPFSIYLLFIVRSRNSRINDPIRFTSNAKWPVSRRWSSALGISFKEFSAFHGKDSIVFAQVFMEIVPPIGIDIQISFCVVED